MQMARQPEQPSRPASHQQLSYYVEAPTKPPDWASSQTCELIRQRHIRSWHPKYEACIGTTASCSHCQNKTIINLCGLGDNDKTVAAMSIDAAHLLP